MRWDDLMLSARYDGLLSVSFAADSQRKLNVAWHDRYSVNVFKTVNLLLKEKHFKSLTFLRESRTSWYPRTSRSCKLQLLPAMLSKLQTGSESQAWSWLWFLWPSAGKEHAWSIARSSSDIVEFPLMQPSQVEIFLLSSQPFQLRCSSSPHSGQSGANVFLWISMPWSWFPGSCRPLKKFDMFRYGQLNNAVD